jgi:hypothetical protein
LVLFLLLLSTGLPNALEDLKKLKKENKSKKAMGRRKMFLMAFFLTGFGRLASDHF